MTKSNKPQFVEVTAPAALPAGYTFTANLDGRTFDVVTPPGGVRKGELISVPYPKEFNGSAGYNSSMGSYQPPTGQWKDGLCHCCRNGCCDPQLWCAFCCAVPFMGQIMTRMNLTCVGTKGTYEKTKNTFRIIVTWFVVLQVALLVFNYIQKNILINFVNSNPGLTNEETTQLDYQLLLEDIRWSGVLGPLKTAACFVADVIGITVSIWLIVTMVRTRMYIRRKYNIPNTCCGEDCCGDCCVSFWCPCCTLGQMARHTSDREVLPPACCTDTGLAKMV